MSENLVVLYEKDYDALVAAAKAARDPLVLLGNYIGNAWAGGGGVEAFDRTAILLALDKLPEVLDFEDQAHLWAREQESWRPGP